MNYEYFISFHFYVKDGNGSGNTKFICNNKISNIDDIRELEKEIQKSNKFERVIILNYQMLRKFKEVQQ